MVVIMTSISFFSSTLCSLSLSSCSSSSSTFLLFSTSTSSSACGGENVGEIGKWGLQKKKVSTSIHVFLHHNMYYMKLLLLIVSNFGSVQSDPVSKRNSFGFLQRSSFWGEKLRLMNQMSIFCVQIQPPVSVADDTHSPCFMFNAHVFLHASLYLVLAWGHASYKTISLSIAFNSFRSLESFPSFYPFLLFMLTFFRPLWSHHPHTMVNSDDDH